jgi:glyoxylase-like metal-dependent hydrolase (beta-lactamase superfamily II)
LSLPESKHFQLQRLTDGVYAAVATERGHAICNAGIIDTGDRTIVFDTFISPDPAKDLLKAAKRLTPQNVIRVVNSHYHNDHIGATKLSHRRRHHQHGSCIGNRSQEPRRQVGKENIPERLQTQVEAETGERS